MDNNIVPSPPVVKPIQKRTKAACVHCQTAKVACSSMRPCVWCIRHGLQDSCIDAPKKDRKPNKRKSPGDDSLRSPSDDSPNNNQFSNVSVVPQSTSFTPLIEPMNSFSPATITLFEEENQEDFSIETFLNNITTAPIPETSPLPLSPPELDVTYTQPTLPLSLSSTSTGQVAPDFSELVFAEIKRAQTSMENVALLSQLQQQQNSLPAATIRVPDLNLCECNDQFARMLEYSNAQEFLSMNPNMLDLVLPQLKALVQRRAYKLLTNKATPKIVRTAVFRTKFGASRCCTVVFSPCGQYCRLSILRHSTGVPERTARKLECISALNNAKQRKFSDEAFS